MKCELCENKGWLKVDGRLGDEIQKCQDCSKFESDKQAYDKAKKETDVTNYTHDIF